MFENKEPKQKQTKVEIYLGGEQEQSSSSTEWGRKFVGFAKVCKLKFKISTVFTPL
jgi:hypothetical protein